MFLLLYIPWINPFLVWWALLDISAQQRGQRGAICVYTLSQWQSVWCQKIGGSTDPLDLSPFGLPPESESSKLLVLESCLSYRPEATLQKWVELIILWKPLFWSREAKWHNYSGPRVKIRFTTLIVMSSTRMSVQLLHDCWCTYVTSHHIIAHVWDKNHSSECVYNIMSITPTSTLNLPHKVSLCTPRLHCTILWLWAGMLKTMRISLYLH